MKASDIKENVEVLSITGTYGGCVLEDELNALRVIPKFFANKAFQFLNDTMKGKYGRIELLELRRSLYTSRRLFCIGRTYAEAHAETNGRISTSYYDETLDSEKYGADIRRFAEFPKHVIVEDIHHDPFVEGRAFTIKLDFNGYDIEPNVGIIVTSAIFQAFGFTVMDSKRYPSPYTMDVVMSYGNKGNNYISFDEGCSKELFRTLLIGLREWGHSTGNESQSIWNSEMNEMVARIRAFKDVEFKRDVSSDRELPTLGYKALPLIF